MSDIEQAMKRDLDKKADEAFDEVHEVSNLPLAEKALADLKETYYEECEAFT